MPRDKSIKKVLVIGSGPIVIGQAAEFDYAGAQACRVLKDEKIDVVLVNSNPATIMTDKALADEIYLEPLTAETIKRIIKKEKPDSILAGLGGQTGLTIAMELETEGFLKKSGVRLLGTNAKSIIRSEDRELFKEAMAKISKPTIPSDIATTVEEAAAVAARIGYPVIIRPAFTLGGSGGGVAYNEEELCRKAQIGIDVSPISQVLVERYIYGWKEIEFEVMRDAVGNVIAVCSMENLDPVGVHTGDSIVVAPTQTLADKEFQLLRSASLDIITELEVVGGCNCQFALNPDSFEYAVIEVNPRVSRSSALASKATGYPIAKITTKIAIGYTLDEIQNDITGKTCACFEPTLDYVALKFPKWPFDKFYGSSRKLGTKMKATGEVMAIANSFEAALLKAVRGAEISRDTLNSEPLDNRDVRERLHDINDRRIFTVFEAIKSGVSTEEIFNITKIDRWFLGRLKRLADFEAALSQLGEKTDDRQGDGVTDKPRPDEPCLPEDIYLKAKRLGYTDKAIKRISKVERLPQLDAVYKMVDTCGAEFDAETPYFYSTYDKVCESRGFVRSGKPCIIVLGSGPIRIGQGIEFDYSSVHCAMMLRSLQYDVVIINNNPETVSTDYDIADRLYFEPLTEEDVMNVIKVEKPIGIVVAFGGQTAIKLTKYLDENGIKILGTSAEGIDLAEDRERFDRLLEQYKISRPPGAGVRSTAEAVETAEKLGYPVLLRPSYVIGGQNMTIARSRESVITYMERILSGTIESPVLVDKYMGGIELEVDVISDGRDVLIPGVMEHIERAGVHSGDSIAVYPPYNINDIMLENLIEKSTELALAMGTRGPVNIQYLVYNGELYVIEVNPRASRTVPYISKVTGVPIVDIATQVMIGKTLRELGVKPGLAKTPPYYAVKVPVFSFEKLTDANSYLGPEMKSTGEVLGIGRTLNEAMFKGLTSAGMKISVPSLSNRVGVLISVDNHDIPEMPGLVKKLDDLKMTIYATRDTAAAIEAMGIDVVSVNGIGRDDEAWELLEDGKISYIIYTGAVRDDTIDNYMLLHRRAVQLSVVCLTSLDTANVLADTIASRFNLSNTELTDICHLRTEHTILNFAKMQDLGNDYIFIDNRDGDVTGPESLCVTLSDRHTGIGGDGIVLIENSDIADIKMRSFNRDGSEGKMAGNSLRCVAKYLYDKDIVKKLDMSVETASGVRELELCIRNGEVTFVRVHMGKAEFEPESLPCTIKAERLIDYPCKIGENEYRINCVNVGNPHCVVFVKRVDLVEVERIGPEFENADIFPERINTEFVRVINSRTIKMRVWERGNGETLACGTGACAAVAAAVENGYCPHDEDITVKLSGGDLVVNYASNGDIIMSGGADLVFEGTVRI